MKAIIERFLRDERGVSAIEYSVIGASIALLLVVSLTSIGSKVNGNFTSAGDGLP